MNFAFRILPRKANTAGGNISPTPSRANCPPARDGLLFGMNGGGSAATVPGPVVTDL